MRLIILKFCTMQDYMANDVMLIWQLMDDVVRINCIGIVGPAPPIL
jgi:hypothetical protein